MLNGGELGGWQEGELVKPQRRLGGVDDTNSFTVNSGTQDTENLPKNKNEKKKEEKRQGSCGGRNGPNRRQKKKKRLIPQRPAKRKKRSR